MKRFSILTVLIVVLAMASMSFAANKLAMGEATVTDNKVVVPVEITNADGLMAIDIPLKFSEGVILKEVTFEGTRTDYFDLKISDIDNENHTVAIGLITQMTATPKPELIAGTGPVANLVFEIVDPAVKDISIEAVSMSKPDHDLMFIYQDYVDGKVVSQRVEEGKFENSSVALSGVANGTVPTHFELAQNYPNPFNPTTTIEWAMAKEADYRLTIFNVLGQVVSNYSGHGEAGVHSVEWDAAQFSSGVYFYKLEAGDFTDTKKMMMLK